MFEDIQLTTEGEENDNRIFVGNGWDYAAKRSVNAVEAEANGKFPWHEWQKMRKQEILEHIHAKIVRIEGDKAVSFDINLLKKAQKKALLDLFVEDSTTEYHHVDIWEKGRLWRHQAVGYFGISEERLITVADEEIKKTISSIRAANISVNNARKARREREL